MPPSKDAPASSNTCEISLINTTTDLAVETSALMQPEIKGHETLNLPTFAFLIYNARLKKRILFDMGSRKDWWNLTPVVVSAIQGQGVPGIRITKDIDEILVEGGVDPKTIDAVVWSHYHWDHVGNIQKFPLSTDVVVAEGFQKAFLPGYPTGPKSPFHEGDFIGRKVHEVSFDGNLKIGRLRAFDYFGDNSFYILDTPGHTAGHVSGLVRTTADTFIFLGGDISHFPGMYRPSANVPMPDTIPAETRLDAGRFVHPCPCSLFTACHPCGLSSPRSQTEPFYVPSSSATSWYEDPPQAKRSIDAMAEYDADENVFIAIAHDPALGEVCEQFPKSTMNDWKAKQWKPQTTWHFLNELPQKGKPGRPLLVEGQQRVV